MEFIKEFCFKVLVEDGGELNHRFLGICSDANIL